MALIDIKTNLKSLKFGNDRPGGGSSNQPYIQKEIPTDYTNKSPDFPVLISSIKIRTKNYWSKESMEFRKIQDALPKSSLSFSRPILVYGFIASIDYDKRLCEVVIKDCVRL